MNKELYMDQNKWLISVALDRRHLTEGQKAVLANEYREILSEKAKKQRAGIANAVKYGKSSLEATVSSKDDEEQERSRKKASNKFNKGNISSGTVADKIN